MSLGIWPASLTFLDLSATGLLVLLLLLVRVGTRTWAQLCPHSKPVSLLNLSHRYILRGRRAGLVAQPSIYTTW